VLFSAVLTALVVIYAARLLPLWGAALAGLLVALGFQFVLHGKELRAYAMLAMLSVAFPLALEAVAARPTLRRLAVLGAVTAVGAMTHYFFLFAVVLGLVWLWLLSGARDARLRATGAVAAGLVPLFVWLPITVFQAGRVNRYFPAFDWGSVFDLHASLFATGLVWRDTGGAGRYVFLAVVLVGTLLLARRAEGRLCALMAVGPVVLTAVVWALGLHVFNLRNLIVAGPFAAIAVAAAVTSIPFRPLALAATAALAGLSVWAFTVDSALGRTPYDEISGGVVETGWEPSDPIVLFAPFPQVVPLSWYLPGHPRLRLARPGPGSCRHVVAVVENPAGHAWLEAHRDGVLESRRYPFFGYRLASRHREPDVVVARLAWSRELLEDAFRREAFLFRHRLGRPSCLEEKTG
jgi:hypothetical protein